MTTFLVWRPTLVRGGEVSFSGTRGGEGIGRPVPSDVGAGSDSLFDVAFVRVAFDPFHGDNVGPEALDVPRHGFPKVGVGGGKVLRSAILEVGDYSLGARHHILVVEVDGSGFFSPLESPEEGAEFSSIAGLGVGVQGFASVPR